MNWIPGLMGATVGLGDGVVGQLLPPGPNKFKYPHTVYRAAVVGLGVMGELAWDWDPDVTYGLMTAGVTLLGSRLPAAVLQGGGVSALGLRQAAPALSGGGATPTPARIAPMAPLPAIPAPASQIPRLGAPASGGGVADGSGREPSFGAEDEPSPLG